MVCYHLYGLSLLLMSSEPIIKVKIVRTLFLFYEEKNKRHLWKFIKPGNLVKVTLVFRLTAPAFLWASILPRRTVRKLLPCNKSQTLCQLIKSTTDGYKFNWNESAAQQFPQTVAPGSPCQGMAGPGQYIQTASPSHPLTISMSAPVCHSNWIGPELQAANCQHESRLNSTPIVVLFAPLIFPIVQTIISNYKYSAKLGSGSKNKWTNN